MDKILCLFWVWPHICLKTIIIIPLRKLMIFPTNHKSKPCRIIYCPHQRNLFQATIVKENNSMSISTNMHKNHSLICNLETMTFHKKDKSSLEWSKSTIKDWRKDIKCRILSFSINYWINSSKSNNSKVDLYMKNRLLPSWKGLWGSVLYNSTMS